MGALRSWPEFLYLITTHGFYHTVCISTMYKGVSGFWTYLFVMSKLIELGEDALDVYAPSTGVHRNWRGHSTRQSRSTSVDGMLFSEIQKLSGCESSYTTTLEKKICQDLAMFFNLNKAIAISRSAIHLQTICNKQTANIALPSLNRWHTLHHIAETAADLSPLVSPHHGFVLRLGLLHGPHGTGSMVSSHELHCPRSHVHILCLQIYEV